MNTYLIKSFSLRLLNEELEKITKDIPNIITFIIENNLLNKKGIIICEISDINLIKEYNELDLIKQKKYGDKYIIIYKDKHWQRCEYILK